MPCSSLIRNKERFDFFRNKSLPVKGYNLTNCKLVDSGLEYRQQMTLAQNFAPVLDQLLTQLADSTYMCMAVV